MIDEKWLCDKYLGKPGFQYVAWDEVKRKWVVAYSKRVPLRTRAWLRVRKTVGGWPVRFRKIGEIKAFNSRLDKHRPVMGGISIGHKDVTAGTTGGFVKWSNAVYMMLNNHVGANTNRGSLGDAIYQPGPHDGGVTPDNLTELLAAYVPLVADGVNRVDLALIGPFTEYNKNYFGGSTYPTDTFGAGDGHSGLFKEGRTTGLTTDGLVTSANATVNINYGDAGTFRFSNQMIIEPQGGDEEECTAGFFVCLFCRFFNFPFCAKADSGPFSGPGDSGSWILTEHRGETKFVGLLFAGSDEVTIANRRDDVMAALGGLELL